MSTLTQKLYNRVMNKIEVPVKKYLKPISLKRDMDAHRGAFGFSFVLENSPETINLITTNKYYRGTGCLSNWDIPESLKKEIYNAFYEAGCECNVYLCRTFDTSWDKDHTLNHLRGNSSFIWDLDYDSPFDLKFSRFTFFVKWRKINK